MADWIGRTLGRVRIESLVARGGMAEVYLGTHTTLKREVAVKILRNIFDDDPRPRERFEREAQAVAKLRHPNIVQVFDFDTIDGQPYIVMEYIKGPSLSKYLNALHAKNSRLELPQVNKLLTGVAHALQYAHESGVVHRDVKPGNILLTSRSVQIIPGATIPLDFEPVLTDFGLVRFLDSSRQTTVGQTAGTPAYMSPEQAMGLATDGRTDIYSLGIVLYEMLSGNVPFDGETTMSVLLKHLNEAPPPIPGLSPPLQAVLDRALAKMADDRFQDPKEFAAAFDASLHDTSDASTLFTVTRAARPAAVSTPVSQPTPAKPRSLWKPVAIAGALLALVGASFLFRGAFPLGGAATATNIPLTDTPNTSGTVSLGPTGILRFENGNGQLDRANLTAQAMPAAPAGSQYEVWLVNGAEQLSLGVLSVNGEGQGTLDFENPTGQNLLAAYGGVEVRVKAGNGSDANSSERVAYAYTLPQAGLAYLRELLVSSPTTPEQVGLIHGLAQNADVLDRTAEAMLSAYESGDEAATRKSAESLVNLLVGDQSADHKDWDGDGQVADPGDGYGFLLNGDSLGYIRAVYSNADYAVNTSGASRNMIVNGENVKICVQNLASWAPQLRENLLSILNAASLAEMDAAVQRSTALVNQMLRGADLNENGTIDPVAEECGVLAAYNYAYRMADMPLLPVNPVGTPLAASGTGTVTATPTATSTPRFGITVTPSPGINQPPTSPPSQPTNPSSRPTKKPKPTQRPRPTRNNPP